MPIVEVGDVIQNHEGKDVEITEVEHYQWRESPPTSLGWVIIAGEPWAHVTGYTNPFASLQEAIASVRAVLDTLAAERLQPLNTEPVVD